MWSNCKYIWVKNQNYGFKNNYETAFICIKADWAPCHTTAFQAKQERKWSPRKGSLGLPGCDFLRPEGPEPGLPSCWCWGLGLGSLLQQAGADDRSWRTWLFTTVFSAMVPLVSRFSFQQISVTHLFANVIVLLIPIREIIEGCSH